MVMFWKRWKGTLRAEARKVRDYYAQVFEVLRSAFYAKGYCQPSDAAHLAISKAQRYKIIQRLVDDGHFVRRGRDLYYLEPVPVQQPSRPPETIVPEEEPITEEDLSFIINPHSPDNVLSFGVTYAIQI
jgi:hypothetical protein